MTERFGYGFGDDPSMRDDRRAGSPPRPPKDRANGAEVIDLRDELARGEAGQEPHRPVRESRPGHQDQRAQPTDPGTGKPGPNQPGGFASGMPLPTGAGGFGVLNAEAPPNLPVLEEDREERAPAQQPEQREDAGPLAGGLRADLRGREDVPIDGGDGRTTPTLFTSMDTEAIRRQLTDIKARFVDEPREAVYQANDLMNELMQQVVHTLEEECHRLESRLRGSENGTEDLRLLLRELNSFCERLANLNL